MYRKEDQLKGVVDKLEKSLFPLRGKNRNKLFNFNGEAFFAAVTDA